MFSLAKFRLKRSESLLFAEDHEDVEEEAGDFKVDSQRSQDVVLLVRDVGNDYRQHGEHHVGTDDDAHAQRCRKDQGRILEIPGNEHEQKQAGLKNDGSKNTEHEVKDESVTID